MAAYIPHIKNYRPFYIQKGTDGVAIDTTEYGLVAKSTPYPILPAPKTPYKNDWYDEDGDDEYNTAMHYASFEFSVSFYIKTFDGDGETSAQVMRRQIDAFFSQIKHGEFMTYDSYLGLGFRGVRYSGYKEEQAKSRDNWTRAIFTVAFKVNDPLSMITYDASANKLIEK